MPAALPGEDLVAVGIRDLRDGRHTAQGALLARARTRLRSVGVELPTTAEHFADPDAELWDLLDADADTGDTYARYNAMTRRLVSYLDAAAHAQSTD